MDSPSSCQDTKLTDSLKAIRFCSNGTPPVMTPIVHFANTWHPVTRFSLSTQSFGCVWMGLYLPGVGSSATFANISLRMLLATHCGLAAQRLWRKLGFHLTLSKRLAAGPRTHFRSIFVTTPSCLLPFCLVIDTILSFSAYCRIPIVFHPHFLVLIFITYFIQLLIHLRACNPPSISYFTFPPSSS